MREGKPRFKRLNNIELNLKIDIDGHRYLKK